LYLTFPLGLTAYIYQRVYDEIKLKEKKNEEIKSVPRRVTWKSDEVM
jgi:hypothetical protein